MRLLYFNVVVQVLLLKSRRGYSASARGRNFATRGGSSSSSRGERWERMQTTDRDRPTARKFFPNTSDLSSLSSSGRKACGFFLWDAPSALLYHWTNHLLKDCIYEGRGGHKFVRIEPGSILQLLYPWSRYSPDRCVNCGGNFHDHLTLWWSKNLYCPFDLWVDKVKEQGVRLEKNGAGKSKNDRKHSAKRHDKPDYIYHQRYVLDVGDLLGGVTNIRERRRLLKQAVAKYPLITGNVEQRKVLVGRGEQVSYVVPSFQASGRRPSASFRLVRELLLRAIDNLINVEESEKKQKAAKIH